MSDCGTVLDELLKQTGKGECNNGFRHQRQKADRFSGYRLHTSGFVKKVVGFSGNLNDGLHEIRRGHGNRTFEIRPVAACERAAGVDDVNLRSGIILGNGFDKFLKEPVKGGPELGVVFGKKPHGILTVIQIIKEKPRRG